MITFKKCIKSSNKQIELYRRLIKKIKVISLKEPYFFILILGIFLSSYQLSAQEVIGKIFIDSIATDYVKIENISQNYHTHSISMGKFKIKANLQDTLIFETIFSQSKQFIVDSAALKHSIKINLERKLFELNEIVIKAKGRDKLDIKKYNESFQQKIANDKQKHPYLYRSNHGNIGNLSIFMAEKISSLFAVKSKKESESLPSITADDLQNLFTGEDSLFNIDLLHQILKISPKKTYQFFIYCEEQQLSGALLKQNQQFQLLDKLVKLAEEFRK